MEILNTIQAYINTINKFGWVSIEADVKILAGERVVHAKIDGGTTIFDNENEFIRFLDGLYLASVKLTN